jgi:hypothetical protein
MKSKKVSFNETPEIFLTYSSDEYSRHQIDSLLYRKAYRRVSDEEFNHILLMLDMYKLYEMIVHVDSFTNNNQDKLFKINYFKKQ